MFNSHRLIDDEWLTLPKISWSTLSSNSDVLAAFTPNGVMDGAIEEIAGRHPAPTKVLQPIDDRLVERLDAWREQAIRYSRDTEGIDEKLQTLFAQLFVLRAVEDRRLTSQVPTIESIVRGSEKIDRDAWQQLLASARDHIGSNLFDKDPLSEIPAHVVAGVINDLYYPGTLPSADLRYDFSWIEADVLGVAYEKYLSTVLHPLSGAVQTDLFHEASHEVGRFTVRKQSGTYYTPKFIHDYLASRTIAQFYKSKPATSIPTVIDFACGSGSFLVAAIDELLSRLKQLDGSKKWAKEIIQGGYIAGIDVDPKTVAIARLRLWHRLVEEPDALPLPDLSDIIVQGDGLSRETWGDLDRRYDIVLGNPPFLATALVENRRELESRFSVAQGRYDFSSLFVEQALEILAADGCFGLVVPNRLFINKNAALVREVILRKSRLCTIVDFGATQPFADASAYVGCLVGQKRSTTELLPEFIRVIDVKSIEPEYMSALLLRADDLDCTIVGILRSFNARHPRSSTPWVLISSAEMRSRMLMENVAIRLDTIAGIFQGIRTGSNDLFIFERSNSDDYLTHVLNGVGEPAIIETELLEPVVFGTDIQRYGALSAERLLLYPYRNNLAIPESVLKERYPNAWSYLLRNRDLLASRSSVVGGTKWYELIRQRDEDWLRQPKLLIRDLATRTSFTCDAFGRMFVVGGTAVVPEQRELLLPLLAYLNSSPISGFVRQSTPQFRGNFVKFEPQHLQGIPVLRRIVEDEDFARVLGSYADTALLAATAFDAEASAAADELIDTLVRRAMADVGVVLEN